MSPPIKVLVCGAFGTGKTTLIAETLRCCAGGYLVPDVSRLCPYPVNRDQTLPVSLWLLGEQIKSEAASLVESSPRFLICDRGIPDIMSHTIPLTVDSSLESLGSAFLHLSETWAKTYDIIVWAKRDPLRFIEPDDIRLSDPEYQRQMEQNIEQALKVLDLRFEVLPSSQSDRIEFLKQRIGCAVARQETGGTS